jgi:hypothetical protein
MSDNDRTEPECEQLGKRAKRAYNYMMGTMDGDEMWEMWRELQYMRSCYAVACLSARELVNAFAVEKWELGYPDEVDEALDKGEFPQKLYDKIHAYADRAAEYVASNYEFNYYDQITNWGTDLIAEYADDDGYQWPGELGVLALCASEKEESNQ